VEMNLPIGVKINRDGLVDEEDHGHSFRCNSQ
jgi:hypothetical protein